MKITIEMSDELVAIDGVLCRIWNGHAENGVPVRVYIHRVAVPIKVPLKQGAALTECLSAMPNPKTERKQWKT